MLRLGLILMALWTGPALAQGLRVHGTIGRTSSDMNWDHGNGDISSANQNREAFYAAVGIRRRFVRPFSIAADLQLAPKGYNRTAPTVHSTFLEVPVLFLWEWSSDIRTTQLYLGAGVAPAVMLWCRRFFVGNIGRHVDDCAHATYGGQPLEAFRRWDISKEWRLGVRRAVTNGRLMGNLRLSSSLTDQQPGPESRATTTRYFVVGWSLGYEIAIR